ncbi:hypothetical protein ACH5RR_026800 [Cinchona calisaya]|uniref:Mannan endo-1,4-beta-mannosidase n=1 Tax=Cinchona calisaya TaxID=153742 RepID=A0ABD2Z8K8_9GENT
MVATRDSQSPPTTILGEEATQKTHLATNQVQRKTLLIASNSDERCISMAVEFRHSQIDQSKNIDVAALCPLDNVLLLIGAVQDPSMAATVLSIGKKDTPSAAGEIMVNVATHQGKKAIHEHAAEIPQGNKFAAANGQKLGLAGAKSMEAAVAAITNTTRKVEFTAANENIAAAYQRKRMQQQLVVTPDFQVKAVNLGGWLLTEGWIKPSLFDGIPNKDFLDGTGLQFKSVTVEKYLAAETGGGTVIVANRTSASGWETFKLWRINESTFNFRVFNKQFVGLNTAANGTDLVAVASTPGISETFEIFRKSDDLNRVRIRASNGYFLQVKTEELVTADFQGNGTWGDDDPSVFLITTTGGYQGEFQVTNGYGPVKAPLVMREHWRTFIVEDDFRFMSSNGLNAVSIPVGWWIASDPTPPKPFVAGSLLVLDNAFFWAQKYGLKVIIDLHAAPGSQNPWEHSATRDGSQEWGLTDANIQETVAVINFLTARYAVSPSLLAVGLINEPLSPGVSLDNLTKYYKAGYDAVRKHSSTAYVVLSNRLGPSNATELFPLASGLTNSVIDVHYYNLFSDDYSNMTVQQNIDFIQTNRSAQLAHITTSNGPLTFVGEWVAEWEVSGASKEDYQNFAAAQLQVYGRATFGWAYWALKNVNNHWSLEWMIKNGYIKL